jgi:hypothetical protein
MHTTPPPDGYPMVHIYVWQGWRGESNALTHISTFSRAGVIGATRSHLHTRTSNGASSDLTKYWSDHFLIINLLYSAVISTRY